MLVSFYFPFSDERCLWAARDSVVRSGFLRPDQPHRFQKNIGTVLKRPLGGFSGWIGESNICEIGHSIRLSHPFDQKRSHLATHLAYKRMYFDGDHCGYFNIGFQIQDDIITNPISSATLPELVEELCNVQLTSRHRPRLSGIVLRDFFKLAASIYLSGSTKKKRSYDVLDDIEKFAMATPLVITSSSIDGALIAKQWKHCKKLNCAVDRHTNVAAYYGPLESWRGGTLIALACANHQEAVRSRFLRSGIARLYLELFSLQRKVGLIQSKDFDLLDCEGRNIVSTSIRRALKRLQGSDRPSIGSSQSDYEFLVAAFSKIIAQGQVADLETIIERLSARPNLRRMLTQSLALNNVAAAVAIEKVEVVMTKNEASSGGIVFGGNVANSGQIITGGKARMTNNTISSIDESFAAIEQAIRLSPTNQSEALAKLADLKAEASKGDKADDTIVAKLVDGLVGLVPSAISAVAAAFGTPILGAIAGPVTKYVLKKTLGE